MGKEGLKTRTINIRQGFDKSRCGESPYNFSPRKQDKVIREISKAIQTEAEKNRIKQIKSEELSKRIVLD